MSRLLELLLISAGAAGTMSLILCWLDRELMKDDG